MQDTGRCESLEHMWTGRWSVAVKQNSEVAGFVTVEVNVSLIWTRVFGC